jgi:amino-acid N-acetyltransferase
MRIRKARFDDVEEIYTLINEYAARRVMLPKSRVELYRALRDFFVAEDVRNANDGHGKIVGCAALHPAWSDTAEIRSVAVRTDRGRRGVGSRLIRACLKDAETLGLRRIFLLTYVPGFFAKFGFQVVGHDALPQKVWTDCIHCPHYLNCNETAMMLTLSVQRATE